MGPFNHFVYCGVCSFGFRLDTMYNPVEMSLFCSEQYKSTTLRQKRKLTSKISFYCRENISYTCWSSLYRTIELSKPRITIVQKLHRSMKPSQNKNYYINLHHPESPKLGFSGKLPSIYLFLFRYIVAFEEHMIRMMYIQIPEPIVTWAYEVVDFLSAMNSISGPVSNLELIDRNSKDC